MAIDIHLFTQLISKPVMFDVLKEVLRNRSLGGWAVAKKLNKDTKEVEQALGELKSMGLLDSESAGSDGILDEFYYPTKRSLVLDEELKGR
jgi:predicted transcriptional regulator